MPAKIKILRATAANSPPPTLEQGELAVNGLADPAELWTGVPTTRDPTGRINLLADGVAVLPLPIADGGTGATTAPVALDNLSGSSGAMVGALVRSALGAWSLGAAGGGVTVSATAPVGAAQGDLWFDSVGAQMYVRFAGQWVVVINQPTERGPKGDTGEKGDQGNPGVTPHIGANQHWFLGATDLGVVAEGVNGTNGTNGMAATIAVGTTTTLAPGAAASVTNSGTANAAVLDFGLPLPALVMAQRTAPIMLAAANGAVVLTGTGPQLLRIGNTVFCTYQGANKASVTANTISIAEIPPGYQPTANVAQAIQTPAITMNVQQYTGATTVFPDTPGANQAAGGQRWSLRHGTQFAANAAISLSMQWRTADAVA